MHRKLISLLLKTPLPFIFLILMATGCHTPEDLREIGPQQELIESEWNPNPQDTPSSVEPQGISTPNPGEPTLETLRSSNARIRTPMIMSKTSPCRNC